MAEDKTITAVATPEGIGAIAVIRISGKKAYKIFEKIVKEKKKFVESNDRSANLYKIIDSNNNLIDEVIAIKYRSPKTFTGENLIEILSHGGYYTVKKLIQEILQNGARIAEKGEFTKRAFLNGKIDLLKAESINALIKSKNSIEHEIAIKSYSGEGSKRLNEIEEKIKEELSLLEAEIEFGDDNPGEINQRQNTTIKEIIQIVEEEIKRIKLIEGKRVGFSISIIGHSNAGKSSLFNTILGYNRSIVNERMGTTRDKISETINIAGKEILINDTAGIRQTKDDIEKEGQKITEEATKEASIIIWVTDGSQKITKIEKETFERIKNKKVIVVINKSDLEKNKEKQLFYQKQKIEQTVVSVKNRENINSLIKTIEKWISEFYKEVKTPNMFLNERQKNSAIIINTNLKMALKKWKQKEIAAYYLNKSLEEIEKTSGKIDKDLIINKIFEGFCIGK